MLAVLSAVASVTVFTAGVSGGFSGDGTHGEGSSAYFVGALVAMLLTAVFTYLGLSAKPSDR